MPHRLRGKTALITGSSSGLGRQICLAYAREGANICCVDLYPTPRNILDPSTGQPRSRADDWNNRERGGLGTHELLQQQQQQADEGEGEEEEGKKKERFIYVKADVSIAGDVEEAVRQCVQVFGRLDIMVNNAGISVESTNVRALKVHETSEEAWDRTMAINAKGVFLGCKYACQQMMEQDVKEEWGGDRGWIVNTASIQGLVAYQGTLLKTAMTTNVTATPSSLASIDAAHPFGGMGDPSDIAKVAVVLASDDAAWITGVALPVDGGYTAQ
ncbi:hypothetical protein MMC24_002929 [Lignoscripta atroalba]|nr:hypothetical protein [Lignoscripta atroalba]